MAKWKKTVWKGYILYDSNYDILENYRASKGISGYHCEIGKAE